LSIDGRAINKNMAINSSKIDLLVVDEKSNFLDSLEKLLFFLTQTEEGKEKMSWKWAIVALYEALYGAMILALQGGNFKRVIELCRTCKKTRSGKLISFEDAFKWIQEENKLPRRTGVKKFVPSEKQKEAILCISQDFRNNFVHFVPQTWFIDIKKFPETFKSCLGIIRFCLFESGSIPLLESEKKPYGDLLVKIDTCLNKKMKAPRLAARTEK